MKASVNKDLCIGCGSCAVIADNIFEIDDDGFATVFNHDIKEEDINDLNDAKNSCPVDAISIEE